MRASKEHKVIEEKLFLVKAKKRGKEKDRRRRRQCMVQANRVCSQRALTDAI